MQPRKDGTPEQAAAEGPAAVVVAFGNNNTGGAPHHERDAAAAADHRTTTSSNSSKDMDEGCVCSWGADCARFRRYFERIRENKGECVWAGTYRPKSTSRARLANFLDAVDRHLMTSENTQRRRTGGPYAMARHHWSKEVWEYCSMQQPRGGGQDVLLQPVNADVAHALGLDVMDPMNRFTPHLVRDAHGRTRPDRTLQGLLSLQEPPQWVMAPNQSLEQVKKIVDELMDQEIRERCAQLQESRRRQAAASTTTTATTTAPP